jgi:hypothetical protein
METKTNMIKEFEKLLVAGVPLAGINTLDPQQTISKLAATFRPMQQGPDKGLVPIPRSDEEDGIQFVVIFDEVQGLYGYTKHDEEMLRSKDMLTVKQPVGVLVRAKELPPDTLLFLVNAHHELDRRDNGPWMTAFWNLRNTMESNGNTAVLLGPHLNLPMELSYDVILLDEDLPNEDELSDTVTEIAAQYELEIPADVLDKAKHALRGVPHFAARQAVALSMNQDGLDIATLWKRNIQQINTTEGLSVYTGPACFERLGGLTEAKSRFHRIIGGRRSIRVIVWVDEGEKDMGGVDSQANHTAKDELKMLLTEMVDRDYTGAGFVGVPGAAKSEMAKAIANEARVLCIRLDLGGTRGSGLVGQAEKAIRQAMKTIHAIAGDGGAFFIMTSNDLSAVKPEFLSRLHKGIWYFDLPTEDAREQIWEIYLKRYEMHPYPEVRVEVNDEGWTGREIEACVRTAHDEMVSLAEAAKSIIPVSVWNRPLIEKLREQAHGRYLSADYPGPYQKPDSILTPSSGARRRKLRT